MVQQAFSYIEKISNLDVKLKLIDTLRTVTAGKVSVQTISINIFVIVLDNKFQFFCSYTIKSYKRYLILNSGIALYPALQG